MRARKGEDAKESKSVTDTHIHTGVQSTTKRNINHIDDFKNLCTFILKKYLKFTPYTKCFFVQMPTKRAINLL